MSERRVRGWVARRGGMLVAPRSDWYCLLACGLVLGLCVTETHGAYDNCTNVGSYPGEAYWKCRMVDDIEGQYHVLPPYIPDRTALRIDVSSSIMKVPRSQSPRMMIGADKLQVLIGLGSTWTPVAGPSGMFLPHNATLASLATAHSLLCFMSFVNIHHSNELFVRAVASEPMDATLSLHLQAETYSSSRTTYSRNVGSRSGSSVIMSFEIESVGQSLQRLRFQVQRRAAQFGIEEPPLDDTHVYVFPDNNACIQDFIHLGGCANPDEVLACLKGADIAFAHAHGGNHVAMHISLQSKADLTLSESSNPALEAGRWFVLMTCAARRDKPSAACADRGLTMTSVPVSNVGWLLALAALAMLLGTWTFLLLVDATMVVAYRCILYACADDTAHDYEGMWPAMCGLPNRAFRQTCWQNILSLCNPTPFFASLLALMMGSFLATAAQFVGTHFWLMMRTGDCDICYYNTSCYFPGLGVYVPINHVLISHIPYFVAGIHTLMQTAFAETKARMYGDRTGKISLDVRSFYALGLSFICEGFGSACYHICPSVETFQFDTAFMIPIAHLAMTCLEKETDEDSGMDETTALKYFLYILTPIWIINFIGSWYDAGVMDNDVIYVVFSVAVIVWVLAVVQCLDPFFAHTRAACWIRSCLKGFLVLGLASSVVMPGVRDSLGGMANTLLLLSIVAMAVVMIRQVFILEVSFQKCGFREIGEHLLKYGHVLLMVGVGVAALMCFRDSVRDANPESSPAESHEFNQDCVLLDVLDLHDVWHFLSAIALALFAMVLLDVKMHAYARQVGIQIVGEVSGDKDDSYVPSSDTDSDLS